MESYTDLGCDLGVIDLVPDSLGEGDSPKGGSRILGVVFMSDLYKAMWGEDMPESDPFGLKGRASGETVHLDLTGPQDAVGALASALGDIPGIYFLGPGEVIQPGNVSQGRVKFRVIAVVTQQLLSALRVDKSSAEAADG